ncbi:MAG: LexA family transcriptional regulator [Treponema sp.]|nr:LexA family transcriptional regulator [Treponema sp.]
MQNLTNYLLETRKSLGLSQTKLAKELGIPQTTWASYEIGKAKPPIKILTKLAQMGYPYSELMAGSSAQILEKISERTGVSKEEITKQRFEQIKDYPADTPMENMPAPKYAKTFDVFRLKHGTMIPLDAKETDFDALVLLPVFTQTAAAGRGQPETQLQEVDKYIPTVLEMLGGANPKNCGIVRVVGDSMTDMNLFNGDFAVFDRTQIDGDGVYVISIGADVRVKHLEYRPLERKIVISSENAKRYPNPEIISYEQAENMLRIHGKVISWLHRNPY